MHVGAAREHVEAALLQRLAERPRVRDRLALALAELLAARDPQAHRLRGDDVLERPALLAGEHGLVDRLRVLLLAQDQARARAAERLVRRGRDHVGVRHRAGVLAGGDEAREVRHVDEQLRAHVVGDAAELGEVEVARIRGPARDDHLRPVLLREPLDLLHVDEVVLLAHLVADDLVELARHVQLHAVREVAAVRELHPEDRVARVAQRHVDGVVRLRAGVRLDVRVVGAEQRLGAVDRELLGDVDPLAAAVVALAGQALGVLVGEDRAGRLEDRARHEVLGGDHLERVLLALELVLQRIRDLGVDRRQRLVEVAGFQVRQVASFRAPFSIIAICSTRRWWRPPSNSAARKASMMACASPDAEPAAGQREHVRVVVAACHLRVLGVTRVHRPHTLELVRHDAHAGAGAAREHGEVGVALGDHGRGAGGVDRVVDRLLGVGAAVHDVVPRALERGHDRLLQRVARMVESGGDSHGS